MRETLTTRDLAARLGLSPSTVRAYAASGRIPSRATPGGHRRFVLDEVSEALGRSPSQPLSLGQVRARREEISEIARRHGAANVRVVGSVARGEQRPGSDIDFLVDMESGRTLLDVAALDDDLEALLGHPVDVLSSRIARGRLSHVLAEAVAL